MGPRSKTGTPLAYIRKLSCPTMPVRTNIIRHRTAMCNCKHTRTGIFRITGRTTRGFKPFFVTSIIQKDDSIFYTRSFGGLHLTYMIILIRQRFYIHAIASPQPAPFGPHRRGYGSRSAQTLCQEQV